MFGKCSQVFSVLPPLLAFLTSGWPGVSGMKVYTSGVVEAVNGTDVRLKCTFRSSNPIRRSALTISWSFRAFRAGDEETVFYYHERPFPPTEGHFRDRVKFVGEVSSGDASILIRDVGFGHNGTFSCQVKNPPDVHGYLGRVQLRVVASAPLSEMVILAVATGGAVLLAIVLFVAFACVRRCREEAGPRPEDSTPW